jgi:hypothetical protein
MCGKKAIRNTKFIERYLELPQQMGSSRKEYVGKQVYKEALKQKSE